MEEPINICFSQKQLNDFVRDLIDAVSVVEKHGSTPLAHRLKYHMSLICERGNFDILNTLAYGSTPLNGYMGSQWNIMQLLSVFKSSGEVDTK